MAFVRLYSKSTANPKDIDFARIGTTVKNKIPEAAVKAFNAKVPKAQATPFDFGFDFDPTTGKLQISVKKAGADFVFGWSDAVFAEKKAKMKVVETDIAGWKVKIDEANQGLGRIYHEANEIARTVLRLESMAKSRTGDNAHVQEVDATKAALKKLGDDAEALRAQTGQFWNSGPNLGVVGLMKKHGLPEDQIVEERSQANAEYQVVQQTLTKFQEAFKALQQQVAAMEKGIQAAGTDLVATENFKQDRAQETEDAVVEIQKAIGEIQGYTNTDFAGVKAKELTKEAKEFAGKSGAAWTKLSADPGEIDKVVARNKEVNNQMRVLGGRVEQRLRSWQRVPVAGRKELEKYQGMLKMVYDEYMGALGTLQNTSQAYTDGLLKYRPKAVELAAKSAKATAKAEAKVAKKGK